MTMNDALWSVFIASVLAAFASALVTRWLWPRVIQRDVYVRTVGVSSVSALQEKIAIAVLPSIVDRLLAEDPNVSAYVIGQTVRLIIEQVIIELEKKR